MQSGWGQVSLQGEHVTGHSGDSELCSQLHPAVSHHSGAPKSGSGEGVVLKEVSSWGKYKVSAASE